MPRYGYLLPTRGAVLASEDSATLTATVQADVVGLAKRAEAMGLDSVWVGDSVLAKPRLEPLATLASVAAATEAVELGTAVYLPTLRHPAHVAHTTATVDHLSGGRLNLGIGVGIGSAVQAEYANLGLDYAERGARMDELLEVVTGLWEGTPVDFDGEFFDLDAASIGFSPTRRPPIYIPSTSIDPDDGFPRPIHDRLLAHGDGWMPAGLSPRRYGEGLGQIRDTLADAGRDPAAFRGAFYLDVVIDEDEATALETGRQFYEDYYPSWDRLSDEEMRDRGAFGTPDAVAQTIAAYEDAGVEQLVVRFTATEQREQLRRFADLLD
jgi:probable F420-dependent oxidoreductase